MKAYSFLLVVILVAQSCAIVDGYKDNQHSWYADALTPEERRRIDAGETIERTIQTPNTTGTLFCLKGNPKIGKYNFVEVGTWKESFEYSSGNFIKGDMRVETSYDAHGNVLTRTVLDKPKGANDFYTREIWTSKMEIFENDSVLTQSIKTFNKNQKPATEFSLAVVNHQESLSDRLKTKLRVGTEKIFDDTGKLKSETIYAYKDRIKAGR